jgi:hypothetical protein
VEAWGAADSQRVRNARHVIYGPLAHKWVWCVATGPCTLKQYPCNIWSPYPRLMEGTLERPFHLLVCGFLICFLFHEAASHISLSFPTHIVAKTTTLLLSSNSAHPSWDPHPPCSSARFCPSPRQPLHASTRTRQYAGETRSYARPYASILHYNHQILSPDSSRQTTRRRI